MYILAFSLLSIHYITIVIIIGANTEELIYVKKILQSGSGAGRLFFAWYIGMQFIVIVTLGRRLIQDRKRK